MATPEEKQIYLDQHLSRNFKDYYVEKNRELLVTATIENLSFSHGDSTMEYALKNIESMAKQANASEMEQKIYTRPQKHTFFTPFSKVTSQITPQEEEKSKKIPPKPF